MTEKKPESLGTVWEIKAKDTVTVTRPDGSEVTLAPVKGTAYHVLDIPGTYETGDGDTVSAK